MKNNLYRIKNLFSTKTLYLLLGIIFFSLPLFWFYGTSISPSSMGFYSRATDFFIFKEETKALLSNNPGAVNHFTSLILYFFSNLFEAIGIKFSLNIFFILFLIPYYLFLLILSSNFSYSLNNLKSIIVSIGIMSSGLAPYILVFGGLIDGVNLTIITLCLISLTKNKWNAYIALTLLGIITHQIIVIISLMLLLMKFISEYQYFKQANTRKDIDFSEKKLTRRERNLLKLNEEKSVKFDFKYYKKSLAIIFTSLFLFQLFNLIFFSGSGGSYLYNMINIKNSIITGLGQTPLNLFSTLKFLWAPVVIFIYIQLKKDYLTFLILLIPILLSLGSLILWTDITRILYHFLIPLYLIICGSIIQNKNFNLLKINIKSLNSKRLIKIIIICSFINFFTPSLIIQNNDLITYTRLPIIELDNKGNGAETFSFENGTRSWGKTPDGLQNWNVDYNDLILIICTEKEDSQLHSNNSLLINKTSHNFLNTNCIIYLRSFNFLQFKWRLWTELNPEKIYF